MNNPENPSADPQNSGAGVPDAVANGGVAVPQSAHETVRDDTAAPEQGQLHPDPAAHVHQTQSEYTAQAPAHQAQPEYQPQAYQASADYSQQQYPPQQGYAQPQYQAQSNPTGTYPAGFGQPQQYGAPSAAPAQQKPRRSRVDAHGVPYGIGPFTLREAVFLALTVLVLISSFLPFLGGLYSDLFGYTSLWAPAPWLAIPGALLLTAAATLIVLRRLRPAQQLRVGSLSVDQFASAMAISTAAFYVGALFLVVGFPAWFGGSSFGGDTLGGGEVIAPGPGLILGLIFSLASLVPTTFAPFTAPLKDDFARRTESVAHPLARDAAPVPRRPRPIRTVSGPGQEVHSYSAENTGSVQLTPADARPEDFAAYRRKSWSPEPVAAQDPAPADSSADLPEDEPETKSWDSREISESGLSLSNAHPTANVGDDIDEFHAGEEPAPVSAIRHVAEQEVLGEPETAAPQVGQTTPVRAAETAPAESAQPEPEHVQPEHVEPVLSVDSSQAPQPAAVATPPVISTQPFWVYSPVPQPIVDERTGQTVFEIGPSAWALAIVDRGTELVIRHDDGRVGVLRQLSGIMRG